MYKNIKVHLHIKISRGPPGPSQRDETGAKWVQNGFKRVRNGFEMGSNGFEMGSNGFEMGSIPPKTKRSSGPAGAEPT